MADMPCANSTKKLLRRYGRAIMKSHSFRIPKYNLPVRFRPWFLVMTCLAMLILAFLGFTNISRALPINDKVLHFLCFGVATGIFYFIIDIEEDARRVWFWRHCGLMFTGIVCFFGGSILSEIVQSFLPYKEFQIGDVVANLLGSSLGLFVSYNFEKYYRYRREISRLYRPLNSGSASDFEDDVLDASTQLLPMHYDNHSTNKGKASRLADVWDEREEIFGVGGESDDEDYITPIVEPPKIIVSSP